MRFAFLALTFAIVLAPEARAQPPYGPAGSLGDRIQRGLEDNALYLGGGFVGVASGFATVGAMDFVGLPTGVQVVGAYVVGAAGFALGVHGAAQLVGVDGTLRNAFGDAMSGVAIGAPAGIATILLVGATLPESECSSFICIDSRALVAGLVGVGVAISVPVVWVLTDYRNDGSGIRLAPVGPSGLGLSLTADL